MGEQAAELRKIPQSTLRPERRGRKDKVKRTRRVGLALSDAEYEALSAMAASRGLTVAGYAAEAALATTRGEKERWRVGRDLAVREALAEVLAAKTEVIRVGTNVNQAAVVANSEGVVPPWLQSLAGRCSGALAHLEDQVAILAKVARR